MPTEISASVLGATIGATIALLATWAREWIRERRQRKNTASAIVCELRIYQRAISRLTIAARHTSVVYGQGFSQRLFSTAIAELAGLGPIAFFKVRHAYSYCGQLDYVINRFQRRHNLPAEDTANMIPAYVAVLEGTATAIEDALVAMRGYAARRAYSMELPPIRNTPLEDAMMGSG
jgi:hypothetical protein